MKMVTRVATIAGMLLAGWLMADSVLTALDREAEYQEQHAVALRIEACGPGYQRQYEAALKRIGRENGYEVHHEPGCTMRVVRQQS